VQKKKKKKKSNHKKKRRRDLLTDDYEVGQRKNRSAEGGAKKIKRGGEKK